MSKSPDILALGLTGIRVRRVAATRSHSTCTITPFPSIPNRPNDHCRRREVRVGTPPTNCQPTLRFPNNSHWFSRRGSVSFLGAGPRLLYQIDPASWSILPSRLSRIYSTHRKAGIRRFRHGSPAIGDATRPNWKSRPQRGLSYIGTLPCSVGVLGRVQVRPGVRLTGLSAAGGRYWTSWVPTGPLRIASPRGFRRFFRSPGSKGVGLGPKTRVQSAVQDLVRASSEIATCALGVVVGLVVADGQPKALARLNGVSPQRSWHVGRR